MKRKKVVIDMMKKTYFCTKQFDLLSITNYSVK